MMVAEAFSASPIKQLTRRRWETADTVVAASLALVIAVTAIFVLLCFQGYETTLVTSKAKAERAAAIMAEGSRWIVAASSVSLDSVAAEFGAGSSSERLGAAFDRASSSLPAELGLGVYSETGQLVWGRSSTGAPASVANADFFAELADGREISLGRLEPAGDAARFAIARRLDRDGVFGGIAIAVVLGDALSRFAAPQDLAAIPRSA